MRTEHAVSPAKYPRTPYWPFSPSSPGRDDRIHQDPRMFTRREIVVTEKLDGANTLLCGGDVYGRSVSETRRPWQAVVRQRHAWKLAGSDLLLWGEDIYAVHSIAYDPVPIDRTFYAFAAARGDEFLPFDDVQTVAERLRIGVVPVLFRGIFPTVRDLAEFVTACHRDPSALGGQREGVVLRTADRFGRRDFAAHVCKSVRENHVQTDVHWTRTWKPCQISGEAQPAPNGNGQQP